MDERGGGMTEQDEIAALTARVGELERVGCGGLGASWG